jgi:hypothetical protein
MISSLKRIHDFVLEQKKCVLIRTCLFRGTYTNLDAKTNFVVRRSDTHNKEAKKEDALLVLARSCNLNRDGSQMWTN